MNSVLRFAAILFLLVLPLGQLCANERKTTADILYHVCQDVVARTISEVQVSDTSIVVLKIDNGDVSRFFAQPITEIFQRRFTSLFTREKTSGVEVSVSVGDVSVVFGEPFSDGFLSAHRSERQIDLGLRMTATRIEDGKILWAKSQRGSFIDTVYVDDIQELQRSSAPVTKGVMPQRSAMEKFIEPFIIVGAAGVAVYLFFTIRS